MWLGDGGASERGNEQPIIIIKYDVEVIDRVDPGLDGGLVGSG